MGWKCVSYSLSLTLNNFSSATHLPRDHRDYGSPYIYNQQLKLGSAARVWIMQSMTIRTHAGAKLHKSLK